MDKRKLRQQAIKMAINMTRQDIDYQQIMYTIAEKYPELLARKNEEQQHEYVTGIMNYAYHVLRLD